MEAIDRKRPISKISLAIDSGHNIRLEIQKLLERGFKIRFLENGGIHAKVQDDPLLGSVTLYHGQDIPARLLAGDHHFGILGRDRLFEAQLGGAALEEKVPLGISHCDIALEILRGSRYKGPQDLDRKRIATSMPNIALDYLEKFGVTGRIVRYRGKEEGAPRAGVADAVVAVWVSGATARDNGLRRFKEPILRSEAVLVASKQFLAEHGSERIVAQFIASMESLTKSQTEANRVAKPGEAGLTERAKRRITTFQRTSIVVHRFTQAAAALFISQPNHFK